MTSVSTTTQAADSSAKPGTLMTLNGLRGLAAFCVMTYHRPDWFAPHYLLTDAYLAVDFFFMLSGFVLARAYLRRLGSRLGFFTFLNRRLQRLYPLTVLGAALGALVFFIDHHGHVSKLLWVDTAATMLTLPTPWESASWHLDAPMWSLYYELLINVVFGAVITYFGRRWIWLALMLSAIAFVVIYPIEYAELKPQYIEFVGHIVRVSFLFFFGVILEVVNEMGFLRRFRLGLFLGGLLLVVSFMINDAMPGSSLVRFGTVVALYPLIIIGAAHHEPTGLTRRVASISGDVSYPLYLLHFPFLAMIAGAAVVFQHSKQPTSFVEAVARLAIVVVLSWLAFKLYDEPVRALLAKWLDPKRRAVSVAPLETAAS